jgi:hypothetical protein
MRSRHYSRFRFALFLRGTPSVRLVYYMVMDETPGTKHVS